MRLQLRPFYSPDELSTVYGGQYDHSRWPDHIARVRHTGDLLRAMRPVSVADLSCGDGAIVQGAGLPDDVPVYLGDITPGWPHCGPIEQTIEQIPDVDVFVCSETLEHVEDPDRLLTAIRGKARRLLLSTPTGEADDQNPQHYWGWGLDDLNEMLAAAGWSRRKVELFDPEPHYYTFQIWRCS